MGTALKWRGGQPDGILHCCSVPQLCPTLCNPMDCSTLGFPVLCHLPELAQTHVHWVGDAIQPSHSLSLSPPPPTFNLSQHQSLFQWVSSSHQVVKVLEFQLEHQSFQWIFRTDFLYEGLIGSSCSPRDSQSLIQHHNSKASILWSSAFFTVQLSHPYMTTRKTIALFIGKTDAEAETPILWPPDVKNWLTGKDSDSGKDWRQEEKGMTEDEMVGWHHRLNGYEFE